MGCLYRSGPCCGGRWTGCAGRWPQLGPPCPSRNAAAPPGWEDLSPCAPWLGCSWTTGGKTERAVWLVFFFFFIISTLEHFLGRLSEYTPSAASCLTFMQTPTFPPGSCPTRPRIFSLDQRESPGHLYGTMSSSSLLLTQTHTETHTHSIIHYVALLLYVWLIHNITQRGSEWTCNIICLNLNISRFYFSFLCNMKH